MSNLLNFNHEINVESETILVKLDTPESETLYLVRSNLFVLRLSSTVYRIGNDSFSYTLKYQNCTNIDTSGTIDDFILDILLLLSKENIATKIQNNGDNLQVVSRNDILYNIYNFYNKINTRELETFINNGTITNQDGLFNITSGTNIGDYAVLRSKKVIIYGNGVGASTIFTCTFASPAVNTWQLAGLGVTGNGLFFAYNGTDFSILRQYGGCGEVRTLTINTTNTADGTVTIQLNSVTFNISITDASGDLDFIAHQIAENVFTGWNVSHVSNTVIFSSTSTGLKNGTYSYSDTGGSTATFAQTVAGKTETYGFVSRTNWNGSKLDGTTDTRFNFDPTKPNTYRIDYQWGYGRINYYIQDSNSKNFFLCHSIYRSNTDESLNINNPNLKSLFAVYATGTPGTSLTMKVNNFKGIIENPLDLTRINNTNKNSFSLEQTISTTEVNIFTLKLRDIYNGFVNNSQIILTNITLTTVDNRPISLNLILNPTTLGDDTLSDYTNFEEIEENSIVLVDQNTITHTGGLILQRFTITQSALDFNNEIILGRDDLLLFTAFTPGQNQTIRLSVNWIENI